MTTIGVLLDMVAQQAPERVVVGGMADGLTARRLSTMADGGARLLAQADAKALIYLGTNGPAFTSALFAAARAGVPLVPLNYRLSRSQLTLLIAEHEGAVAVADPEFVDQLAETCSHVYSKDSWLEATESHPVEGAPQANGDVAVVIYTSGSTSAPKGVLLRHSNLVSYVVGTVQFGAEDLGECSLVSVPPYHIAAVANAITNLYAGRRYIVLQQFDPRTWLEVVRREHVTHAMVVPTMLARVLELEAHAVPTLRSLAYGGAQMPLSLITAALEAWPHVEFSNAYGLTETSSTIAVLGPEDHRLAAEAADAKVRARLGSVGRPLPGVEVVITRADGEPAGPNEPGRILVRGPQVSGEYAGASALLDSAGFFDTRDGGYLDDDGYLFVIGRLDDTIIRGAENVSPFEIEEVLLTHPSVRDVVVVGVPDAEWGQRIEAVVVPEAGESVESVDAEMLRSYVRTELRGSKTPDRIHVWGTLPRTEVGKLSRRAIAGLLEAERA
ncbi:class I adenylate-forming enzyme family protein [Pseudonocardia xishanensis]|uniref:Acyl-CoA synthetase (AMP-forming)/AMP-acid ligase II n=1 Tax=Pseudonocardia xishanensis TaxID=630995 RepID=A0ABP8RWK2_9PSEU